MPPMFKQLLTEQIEEDETSIGKYGKRTYSKTGMLIDNDTDVLGKALLLLAKYKDPIMRIKSLTLMPQTDTTTFFPLVLGLDISDRITVKCSQASINEDYFVEGISHDYDSRTGVWVTKLELSPANAIS